MKSKKTDREVVQETPEVITWQDKLRHHGSSLIILAITIGVALISTSITVSSKQNRAKKSWQVLGDTLKSTGFEQVLSADFFQKKAALTARSKIFADKTFRDEKFPADFKIKNLKEPARKFLYNVLGNTRGLPKGAVISEEDKENEEEKTIIVEGEDSSSEDLDQVRLRYLPSSLAQKALRIHNIARLEQQLKDARKTSAEPWLCYELAYLYSWENPGKALGYYEIIQDRYPDFSLTREAATFKQITNLMKDSEWRRQHPGLPKFEAKQDSGQEKAILTTSRGKIEIVLFQKDFPTVCDNFTQLVGSGFFNGLNFYKIEQDKVHTGCPLGNGKGVPPRIAQGEIEDFWPRRGLVVMENMEKPGKIGSRFFIVKKFSDLSERHSILGKVTEGMEIVDKLSSEDLLLDVSIEQ